MVIETLSLGFRPQRTIVLVGMMGVGKTSVGRRLAKYLSAPFSDSDQEVEKAAGCTVSDIYDFYGEQAFIDAEYRVIERILAGPPQILATGVGGFAIDKTRRLIQENSLSIWLKADIDAILPRVSRRSHRPQIQKGDMAQTISQLLEAYTPSYEKAHVMVDCCAQNPVKTMELIVTTLQRYKEE